MRLDLGGIGKGWAVDRAAQTLAPVGDALINAGGDIYAMGSDGHHEGWTTGVEHPFGSELISTVELRGRALATSTTALRRWTRNGESRHHLIDSGSGRCARSGVASVSVIAATTVEADVYAKSALIMGEAAGCEFLARVRSPGIFVRDDGPAHVTNDWPDDCNGGVR
jgi:thiamine biosynthesis lipoprotein